MLFKDYGEIDFIKKITRYSETEKIGDDAAELAISDGKILIVTTDMLVEGTHFDYQKDSCFEIGFKSIAVNVSDIDAKGGVSKEALVSFAVNGEVDLDCIDQFYTGVNEAAKHFGIKIVGGDIVSTKNGFVVNITLFGEVEMESLVRRNGAKPNDKVYVTGPLGVSVKNKYKISVGRLKNIGKNGRVIAQNKIANAMTDISDGLSRSLYDVSQESNVGFKIYESKIPLAEGAVLSDALNGGEDFELMFTSDKDVGKGYYCIGKATKKVDLVLINRKGKEEKIKTFGYNQFL